MGVNKVVYGGETVIDITDSTVTEDTLAEGAVAYGANGERITGTMTAGGGGHSVGFEYISFNPNIPTGSIPLLGGTFSRAAYADLWSWVQTQTGYLISEAEWQEKATANNGNVPFYSDGDGSTTFRVPSLKCWVKGANGVEEVGSYLKAGLPNITGSWIPVGVSNHSSANDPATGAFTNKAGNNVDSWSRSGSLQTYGFDFDASLSNPIYGNSDTVQPPSIVGMWLVKAFGTVSNIGNQDIADVSAGLTRVENKMDEYTDNVAYIESFVVETWRSADGSSWYRKYSDGWLEQGGIAVSSSKEMYTLTFPVAFATTNYFFTRSPLWAGTGASNTYHCVGCKTQTETAVTFQTDSTSYYTKILWYACGVMT